MCYRQIVAFSLVTLGGIVVIAVLRRHLRNAANKKDIISQLSDDILISIISRMETKFAVRTSILSKRWSNLYKCASDIDLSCHDLSCHLDSNAIIYRVQRLLRFRSGFRIRSFHFRCGLTKSYADQFEQCICSLGRLGVEELVLYFYCRSGSNNDLSFSCHLLSEIPFLKYFRLVSCSLQPNLKSQCSSLQTLSLMNVTILSGALDCILCNCSRLESLIIDICTCPSKLCFCGTDLQLKSLIKLYASNLFIFEFSSPQVVNFVFDHVPHLQSINLSSENENIMSYAFGKLAKDLPHLKSLAFTTNGDFYQKSRRLMAKRIETFSNLRQLELRLYCTTVNLLTLIPFLKSCSLLEEFHLDIPCNLGYDDGAQVQPTKLVVPLLNLKKVKIRGFNGTDNEIEFVLHILKVQFF